MSMNSIPQTHHTYTRNTVQCTDVQGVSICAFSGNGFDLCASTVCVLGFLFRTGVMIGCHTGMHDSLKVVHLSISLCQWGGCDEGL